MPRSPNLSSVAFSWFDLLDSCFAVLQTELQRGLLQMKRFHSIAGAEAEGDQLGSPGGMSAHGDKDGGSDLQRPGHRRRCQELIGAPRRFVNMEDGMQVPAEQLLEHT